jgi:hypothetical protein
MSNFSQANNTLSFKPRHFFDRYVTRLTSFILSPLHDIIMELHKPMNRFLEKEWRVNITDTRVSIVKMSAFTETGN